MPLLQLIVRDWESDTERLNSKQLLGKTVVLKLNGGLGTGMGLEQAKSLLKVKGEDTFLEIIAKQVKNFRETKGDVKSMFMNSFSTRSRTPSSTPICMLARPNLRGTDEVQFAALIPRRPSRSTLKWSEMTGRLCRTRSPRSRLPPFVLPSTQVI